MTPIATEVWMTDLRNRCPKVQIIFQNIRGTWTIEGRIAQEIVVRVSMKSVKRASTEFRHAYQTAEAHGLLKPRGDQPK